MERRLTVIEGDREALHEAAMRDLVRWICHADDAALARARALDARLAHRAPLSLVAPPDPPVTRG